ncbi:hypothetical protein ERC79_17080 [Rhodococcus sp. ABRD24]|uniref:hypothetical protein n=1 Tax=Rhodococcus sp. ABRD24 TaxID=2507582 RepID=UPI00103A9349|nr:hypothetical protein [Rhodococcus sp. ABRD24]QBJ97462.1 hypothetical protein ERC79_17080 [Rhodococcus sp. ABRD24]
MSDIYGLPDTTGRQEGDTWTTTLPDGRTVKNTIPSGNGNQTVDQQIINPDGSTTNSRVVDNGNGGWQRWNDDSTGTSSYAGKDGQDTEVYGQHFDPGTSTAGQASHEFGISSDYNNTYTASYDEDGNRVGTDVGVANEGGLYDNVHVDSYGNKTFSETTRNEQGGLVSTFTGQVDSEGYGWRDISGKNGPQRWQVSPDSQGKRVLTRTEETDSGVHHFRMDENGKLTDEFRGKNPGEWYRDTIITDADGKTTITRLDVQLDETVYDIDGNIIKKPRDKRNAVRKAVDTTLEFGYGLGRAAFGMTDLGAVYNTVSPLWGQHDAAVTSDDIARETVETLKPIFNGDGHERWQALQAVVVGTNTDEYAEDSTVSITKAILTGATFFIPGPKGLGAIRRGSRDGEGLLIDEMVAAGKSEAEILAAVRELRTVDELRPWQQGARMDAPEVLAAIESSRLSQGGDAHGASGLGEGDSGPTRTGSPESPPRTSPHQTPGEGAPANPSVPEVLPEFSTNSRHDRDLTNSTAPDDTTNMIRVGPLGVKPWDLPGVFNAVTYLSNPARGGVGEAFTRAKLRLEGYEILAEQPTIGVRVDGKWVTVRPDFIVINPKTGKLEVIESKFGKDPRFTRKGQVRAYPELNKGTLTASDLNLSKALDVDGEPLSVRIGELKSAGLLADDVISRVEAHFWNVDYMPTPQIIEMAAKSFALDYETLFRTKVGNWGASARLSQQFLNDLVTEINAAATTAGLPPLLPNYWAKTKNSSNPGLLSMLPVIGIPASLLYMLGQDESAGGADSESDLDLVASLIGNISAPVVSSPPYPETNIARLQRSARSAVPRDESMTVNIVRSSQEAAREPGGREALAVWTYGAHL